jgi:predicted amidohydrolase YtcJ
MFSMPVAGVRPMPPSDAAPADVVVRNAKMYTGDPVLPQASAVAITDGRITKVGDDDAIAAYVGEATQVIDAQGRRAIPGLNDSHLHVIRGGLNYVLELRWDGVPSLALALALLREQAAATPAGQWVRVVGGFTREQFVERRLPTLSELNYAAPDTPVFVLNLYQSALLNRAAVRAAGYTRDTPEPAGGQIVRGPDGTPTGMLLAAPAATLLYQTLGKAPKLTAEDQKVSTRHYLRELNRFGLTSAIDAAGGFQSFPDDYAVVRELAENGELTLRIAYHLFPQVLGQEVADIQRWIQTVTPGDGDDFLRLNGAGENLTWAAADFENFAEPRPELAENYEHEFEKAVRLLCENGWRFRLHATYNETIQRDLAVFEKLAAEGLFPGPGGWFFDHAETVTPDGLERIAALGGAISVQNRMSFQGESFIARYGAPAAQAAPPIRAMLAAGLTVGAGTDATRVSSYNPWVSLHWMVSGRTVGGTVLYPPSNRLSREEALERYTVAGAQLSGEAHLKGILREGYFADLTLLSADYFAIDEADIPHIEAVLTMVGGKVVYADAEFEGLDSQLPEITPTWSPVARFGGYQATQPPSRRGAAQAAALAEAALDSRAQALWTAGRNGERPSVASRHTFEVHQH